MFLEILSPEKTLYSGEAYGMVLPGVDGGFTILDHHTDIIAALKQGEVKVLEQKENTKISFQIKSGFVDIKNNNAKVFIEEKV